MARETVQLLGLTGVLEALEALPPEVVSKAGGPVKLSLKRAAEVLRAEAIANVNKIVQDPNANGLPSDSTGLLAANIVATRGKALRGPEKGEQYRVRIRRKAYQVEGDAKPVNTIQVGRLLEYGTEKRQPMPWLRTAFDAKKNEATQVFVSEMNRRVEAVIKKLEREQRRKQNVP